MRTFKLSAIAFVFGCFAVLAACGGSGGGDDMGDDDPSPDAGNGGSVTQVCTGGNCAETGTPVECQGPDDCACRTAERPQACDDGGCWSEETDCDLPKIECAGAEVRCVDPDTALNCCNDTAYICPADKPRYCPGNGMCHGPGEDCPGSHDGCFDGGATACSP